MLTLLALAGCTQAALDFGERVASRHHGGDDTAGPTGSDDSGATDTADDTADTDTAGEDTGEDPVPVEYDCDVLPDFNLGDTTLTEARAYHGVTFDDDGNLIGWDGRNALVKTAYDGTRAVFVPGLRGVEGMDRLPDGDFVLADSANASVLRVTPEGGTETIATSVGYVYGVYVGPDGMIYVTNGGIERVDPATGEATTLLVAPRRWSAHSLNFSLDSTRMYIGTIGTGDVYYMDLDENLDPITQPELYASGVGTGWHDGVGVDACGNLYVAEYWTAGLYRVAPDGTVTPLVDPGDTSVYGHGLEWGSGLGGWRADALYQPQPYGGSTVREVVVGIPDGDTVRTWNGVATPW